MNFNKTKFSSQKYPTHSFFITSFRYACDFHFPSYRLKHIFKFLIKLTKFLNYKLNSYLTVPFSFKPIMKSL